MAINEQAFHPQAPAFARSNPAAYYAWLTSNGFPHRAAYDQTTGIFGPPKTPEQQQKDTARANQQAGFAQVGGMIGGVVAGRYVMNNAGKWIDQALGREVSEEVVKNAATQFTGMPGSEATQTAWNAGADAATTATPQVISTEGGMSTVQTPTGPQQVPTESINDSSFWGSVNWQRVGQGAIGLMQLYNAYKAWKEGDKSAATLSAIQGGTNLAATAGSETAGAAAPYLSGAAELYKAGAAQFDSNMSEEDKAYAAAMAPARTAAAYYTAGLSSLLEGYAYDQWGGTMRKLENINKSWLSPVGGVYQALRAVGSKKSGAQFLRDKIRDKMQETGAINEKWQGTLADGSVYDFGKDGKTLKWKELDKVAESSPEAWGAAVNLLNPLMNAYGLTGQKRSDVVGWLAKAAVSNAENNPEIAISNVKHMAEQQGLNFDTYQTILNKQFADKKISEKEYNYSMGAIQNLLQSSTPTAPTPPIVTPEKGKVARQSPGLYRNDKGELIPAKSMRQALERAYDKTKENKKEEEL